MKKLLLFPIVLLLFSCEVEGDLTKSVSNSTIPQNTVVDFTAEFIPTSGITVSGNAKIYLENNQRKLKLENFSITDGPDLKVYLSKSNTPNDFVNLGNLNPLAVYTIPQQVDFSTYKYVLIHCQQYNHLFAVGQLTQN